MTTPRPRLPLAMAAAYGAVWVWAAIEPLHPDDWLLENLLVFLTVPALAWTWWRRPLSDSSYALLFLFLALHTVGSHYTYAEVPAGFWLRDTLGLERNHYDRIVHCCFGLLLALPMREMLGRRAGFVAPWTSLFALSVIAALSGLYEVIEWIVVLIVSPETGMAYLGTQGDEFDGQKDMALAMAGAAVALALGGLIRRKRQPSAG